MKEITSLKGLLTALEKRLDYFIEQGCRVTDHSLEKAFFCHETTEENVSCIYLKALENTPVTEKEGAAFRGYILKKLGQMYAERSLVMQIHIGALQNTSTRLYERLGADIGCDSLNDFNYASQLAGLLDSMDITDSLPIEKLVRDAVEIVKEANVAASLAQFGHHAVFVSKLPENLLHIVDRVGGGDSFAAGFLHGYLSDMSISDALEFAIAASAIKHTMPGDINYTTEKEVLALRHSEGSGRVQR